MQTRRVVATGNTYGKRDELKALGFSWEPLSKRWLKDLPQDKARELVASSDETPGLTFTLTRELIPGGLMHEVSPWFLEPARSGRAACRACRGKIAKGELRFGVGDTSNYSERLSYAWFHLRCAVEQYPVQLLEVLGQYTDEVPEREALEAAAKAGKKPKPKAKRSGGGGYPSAERAKSSRSSCMKCEDKIQKGDFRVIVLREVDGVGDRPGYLHPGCATEYVETGDLTADLTANAGLPEDELAELLKAL